MRGAWQENTRLLKFARQMRRSPTDAERKLWKILRSRSLADYKFRRQHPIAGYILDFYCINARLVVELDGSQHGNFENKKYDDDRTKALGKMSVRVIRFWDNDVLKYPDSVAGEILRELESMPSPQPSPGVPGEGRDGARDKGQGKMHTLQPSSGVPGEGEDGARDKGQGKMHALQPSSGISGEGAKTP